MRPLIGITATVEQARYGVWDRPVTLLPQPYVDAVHRAGGRAVLLPPSPDGTDVLLSRLDGLLLSGGVDIDPSRYGAERDPRTQPPQPERDEGELAVLHAAVEADLPVLGICRGMQLMCVAAGGSLIQDLPGAIGSGAHRGAVGVYVEHPVRTVAGSRLAAVVGESLSVPSYHHQGVADAGGLTVTAHADDGTVEGVDLPGATFALGVLWHPEVGSDPRLFEALVAAASLRLRLSIREAGSGSRADVASSKT